MMENPSIKFQSPAATPRKKLFWGNVTYKYIYMWFSNGCRCTSMIFKGRILPYYVTCALIRAIPPRKHGNSLIHLKHSKTRMSQSSGSVAGVRLQNQFWLHHQNLLGHFLKRCDLQNTQVNPQGWWIPASKTTFGFSSSPPVGSLEQLATPPWVTDLWKEDGHLRPGISFNHSLVSTPTFRHFLDIQLYSACRMLPLWRSAICTNDCSHRAAPVAKHGWGAQLHLRPTGWVMIYPFSIVYW